MKRKAKKEQNVNGQFRAKRSDPRLIKRDKNHMFPEGNHLFLSLMQHDEQHAVKLYFSKKRGDPFGL